MAVYINPLSLTESVAVANLICSNCLEDIEIGDDCYTDTTLGLEEPKAKVYCEICINNAGLR